jgi:aryl-alcohol dehydrogenase-like predicted oxidoreductase
MEKRRFGRTGHESTVAIFGAFALSNATQGEADALMELVIESGINHIDVAPSYGVAEERLGPWLARERERFFLGCKTMMRSKTEAETELHQSLERLQVDSFDLYQIHAITTMAELDQVTAPGGALEALIEARQAGRTRYLGITGHGLQAPAIFLEALKRFDFDSVLFPVNFILYADEVYLETSKQLLHICCARDVGTMAIKAIAARPWGEKTPTLNTWYQPFLEIDQIQAAVDFVLSQDVSGICTAGEPSLLTFIVKACESHRPMAIEMQESLIASGGKYQSIFN